MVFHNIMVMLDDATKTNDNWPLLYLGMMPEPYSTREI